MTPTSASTDAADPEKGGGNASAADLQTLRGAAKLATPHIAPRLPATRGIYEGPVQPWWDEQHGGASGSADNLVRPGASRPTSRQDALAASTAVSWHTTRQSWQNTQQSWQATASNEPSGPAACEAPSEQTQLPARPSRLSAAAATRAVSGPPPAQRSRPAREIDHEGGQPIRRSASSRPGKRGQETPKIAVTPAAAAMSLTPTRPVRHHSAASADGLQTDLVSAQKRTEAKLKAMRFQMGQGR